MELSAGTSSYSTTSADPTSMAFPPASGSMGVHSDGDQGGAVHGHCPVMRRSTAWRRTCMARSKTVREGKE
eukprot:15857851-Heterocapsa_arctica.AAC.1